MIILQKIKRFFLNRKLNKIKSSFGHLGTNVQIDISTNFIYPKNLAVGNNVYIGPKGFLNAMAKIEIKSGTIIGPNLMILTANHNFKNPNYLPYDETYILKEVIIGENVWIGANVLILPGTEIEEGAIIGAGTVVSGKIPKMAIVIGNPCQVVSYRNKEKYMDLKNQDKIYLKAKKEGVFQNPHI